MLIAYQSNGVNFDMFVMEQVFEGVIFVCTFEVTLFTLAMSWLTIDGLNCGKTTMAHIWLHQKLLV